MILFINLFNQQNKPLINDMLIWSSRDSTRSEWNPCIPPFLIRPHLWGGEEIHTQLGFLQFEELGALSFILRRCLFYDSKRSIGEVLFLKSFLLEWNAWKNLEWFWCWIKVKSGAKRELFLFMPLFLRAKNWCVKKFSPSERNFFVHVRLLKAVFWDFWCLWGLVMLL